MNDPILYISYNGITEPLVRSQVLNYLEGLTGLGYRFLLLTFEKARMPEAVELSNRRVLQEKGIDWHWLPYHHKPQLLGTAWDVLIGTRLARKLVRRENVRIVHARSFIPALIASRIKRSTGVSFLNDIRGFWVDEKAYKGSLTNDSILFRFGKSLEQKTYRASDAIVTLSEAGAMEVKSWAWWRGQCPPIVTIPTCVKIDAFDLEAGSGSDAPVFGYIGSLGRGYLGKELCQFFRQAQQKFPASRLLIVSRTDRVLLDQYLNEAGVDKRFVETISVPPSEVPNQVKRMDVGLSFIEPHYSKTASCPTKLGEYLAAGVPVIANAGIGDTDAILQRTNTGIIVDDFSSAGTSSTLEQLTQLMADNDLPKRCRAAAESVFSLEMGIDAYSRLYRNLLV